jgi:hypothetical protein
VSVKTERYATAGTGLAASAAGAFAHVAADKHMPAPHQKKETLMTDSRTAKGEVKRPHTVVKKRRNGLFWTY